MHLSPPGKGVFNIEDSFERLEAVLLDIRRRCLRPDALLISGDLAFRGDAACYAQARTLIDSYTLELGIPSVIALGNHDDACAFRRGYLKQHGGTDPYYGETMLGATRVLVLDSRANSQDAKPGMGKGIICEEQLFWLKHRLCADRRTQTLLMLHHPPVSFPMDERELMTNGDELLNVIAEASEPGAQRLPLAGILCGHIHVAGVALVNGVLCAAAPATIFSKIEDEAAEETVFTAEAGYNVVYVKDGTMTIQTLYVDHACEKSRVFSRAYIRDYVRTIDE
jgi:3',5'-cyclic AMP phosphodiesterase CpdA